MKISVNTWRYWKSTSAKHQRRPSIAVQLRLAPPSENALLRLSSIVCPARLDVTLLLDHCGNGKIVLVHLHLLEEDSGVQYGQTERCNQNHRAIKEHELPFRLHDGILPAWPQFRNTPGATCEDCEEGDDQSDHEDLEFCGAKEGVAGRIKGVLLAFDVVVDDQAAEG